MTYFHELIQSRRARFKGLFTRREMKNPVTAASVIAKHIQMHERERYPFGPPPNLIQPQTIVAIIKNQSPQK